MVVSILIVFLFCIPTSLAAGPFVEDSETDGQTDFDPQVNIQVTVEIQKIRSLEKFDHQIPAIEKIDWFSDPDFYVKVICNNEEAVSDVWLNQRYIEPNWSVTFDVPDTEEVVNITIQLWDQQLGPDRLCDISAAYYDDTFLDSYDVELYYNIKTGLWGGDDTNSVIDWFADASGYGRLNGCDDGSVYQRDLDCELWFDIYQNDADGDRIPWWSEVKHWGTDPNVDNRGEDNDGDGVPLEWEYKWGSLTAYHMGQMFYGWMYYDFYYENHTRFDYDYDGLNNYEEYLTSQWGSDPFRPDVFVEMDRMADSPDGFVTDLPEESKELLRTAFNRRNIVFHLDDGCMGGQDIIPFEEYVEGDDLERYYNEYFLHGDENHWRRGIFHYGPLVYQADFNGYMFTDDGYQISANGMEEKAAIPYINREIAYASAYMHELGHNFAFSPIGGHDLESYYPYQVDWWKWRPYKSVMNYGYMYKIVDYSDGSRQRNDFDDWERMDLSAFDDYLEYP